MLRQLCCSALRVLLLSLGSKFWLSVSKPVLVFLHSVITYRWLSSLARCKRGRCVQGGLVLTVMQPEDRWRLTAPLVLQCCCCVMLFFCGLSVCLNLKSLEKVSAFIEYLELKIPSASPIRAEHRLNSEMWLDWMSHGDCYPFSRNWQIFKSHLKGKQNLFMN